MSSASGMSAPFACRPRSPWRLTYALARVGAAVLVVAAALTTQSAAGEAIKIGGTGSGLGTMQRLADALARRGASLQVAIVPNLGSSGGLRALQAGAIDLAVIGRAPKQEELASGLVAVEFGRSPFVFVTNAKAGRLAISRQMAADYFSGRVGQWPDGTPVRVVLRPSIDGDTALQASISAAMAEAVKVAHARPGMVIATTDQDAADECVRLRGSLGTNTLALLLSEERSLQVLALDGVVPSTATLANGAYPHYKSLYLLWREADRSPDVQQFVDFVRSRDGRTLLEQFGFWVPR